MNWRLGKRPPQAGKLPVNLLLETSTFLSRTFSRLSGLARNSEIAAFEAPGIEPVIKLSLISNSCLESREVNHGGMVPVKRL